MKPFLQDNNRREQEARKALLKKALVVFFLCVLFLSGAYLRSGIASFVTGLFLPLLGFGENSVENSAFVLNTFGTKSALVSENTKLKKEIEALNIYKIENRFLREENSRLNDLFNRVERGDAILARALTVPGKTMFDSFLVNTGKANSTKMINPGDTVRVSENITIGDVSEVFNKSSRVTLFSSPNRKTEIYFSDDTKRFVAEGLGGGNFRVLASKEILVKPGDFVYAANYGGLILGIVSLVLDEPSDPFLDVRFRLAVNPYELSSLFIYDREIDS